MAVEVRSASMPVSYTINVEDLSMTDSNTQAPGATEPAGAERFRTYQNTSSALPSLEDRVTELEAVVHALSSRVAPTCSPEQHRTLMGWVGKVGARLKGRV